jgi:hypothetical protein
MAERHCCIGHENLDPDADLKHREGTFAGRSIGDVRRSHDAPDRTHARYLLNGRRQRRDHGKGEAENAEPHDDGKIKPRGKAVMPAS